MTVGWISTRDREARPFGFVEAMLRGLAPDGGLYVPTRIPRIEPREDGSFADHAVSVLSPWLEEAFDAAEIGTVVRDALDFPVPLVDLGEDVTVVELFHGPTLSFKDFGARTMAGLMDRALQGSDAMRTVFVATSGDTGSAVADGFAGRDGVRVVLLYPDGQVSAVQERQIAAPRDGVLAVRIAGSFDDCQRLVKGVFADGRFAGWGPTSANSINVGRLIPQTTYHAWAARLRPGCTVVVPSGNLGNLTAAVLARSAGAPIGRLVAAHNANRGFPTFLDGGPQPSAESVRTLSNAMDVGTPSNFERLEAMLGPDGVRALIRGDWVDDDDTIRTIARVHESSGYVCDPHTAVGLEVVSRLRAQGDRGRFVVMATAHPAKFPDTVARAVGTPVAEPAALGSLPPVPADTAFCEATLDALERVLRERLSG